MERKLSVIVPIYNSERYIGGCVESLLGLRLNKEIIVVDDGSTDASYGIVAKYAAGERCIRLLRQENKGVSAARNRGLDNISGDVIAFVDSDDLIISDRFRALYEEFITSDADMAMGGVRIEFDERHSEFRRAHKSMLRKILDGGQCFAELMRTNTFTPLVFCYLFKTSFINRLRLRFSHRMSEDDLWTSVAMCEARKILVTDVVHYVYRKHDDSITGANMATIFRADNHMGVVDDLYRYVATRSDMPKGAEAWLCCKILYIASIAIKIYHDKKCYGFRLSLGMYQDLLKRLLASPDKYARNVGLMFGKRIIATVKSIDSTCERR